MRAIRQYRFGPPDVLTLEVVPDPQPDAGQVLVRVEVSGVHVVDTSIRSGVEGGPFPLPALPLTPGREIAGTVVTLGGDVDPSWADARVAVHLGQASGGYAELAAAPVDALHRIDDLDASVAVAMIGTGRTAVGVLDTAAITAEDVVLVTAAAGGLGALFVQAARRAGAYVVAVAGGADKVSRARELGADLAVDYLAEGWLDHLRAGLGGRRPTVVLDGIGGNDGAALADLLAPGGRLVVFGWSSGVPNPRGADDLAERGVRHQRGIAPHLLGRADLLRELQQRALAAARAGAWSPLLTSFPLADAARAHRDLADRRTVGKVVLVP